MVPWAAGRRKEKTKFGRSAHRPHRLHFTGEKQTKRGKPSKERGKDSDLENRGGVFRHPAADPSSEGNSFGYTKFDCHGVGVQAAHEREKAKEGLLG